MLRNLFNPLTGSSAVLAAALTMGMMSADPAVAARGAGDSEGAQAGGEQSAGNTNEAGGRCCDGGGDKGGPQGGGEPSVSRDEGGRDPRPAGMCTGQVNFDKSTVAVDDNAQIGDLDFLAQFPKITHKYSSNEDFVSTPVEPNEFGISGTFNVNTGQVLPFYPCQRAIVGQAIYGSGLSENVGADIIVEIENKGFFGVITRDQRVLVPTN